MPIPTLPRLPQSPQFLAWAEVDKLIDHLIPQFRPPYDALMMITRGGIVPGGLIAEALDIRYILTAALQARRQPLGPDYYAAITDRFIIYPWEVQRGPDQVHAGELQSN